MTRRNLQEGILLPNTAVAPATPASTEVALYAKSGSIYKRSSDGVETDLAGGGVGVPPFATTIGDGTSLVYTVTHNVGSRDVGVTVFQAASPYAEVDTAIEHLSPTQVRLTFDVAPAVNELRVVVDSGGTQATSDTVSSIVNAAVAAIPELQPGQGVQVVTGAGVTTIHARGAVVRRTADAAPISNTIVVAPDAVLAIPVDANTIYRISGWIVYTVIETADLRLSWSAPTGSTFDWVMDGLSTGTAAGSTTQQLQRRYRSLANDDTAGGAGAGTFPIVAMPSGLLVTGSTAGFLQLNVAQATAIVSDLVIKAGSHLIAVPVL